VTTDPVVVRLDLFPATVVRGSDREPVVTRTARLYATNDTIYVYEEAGEQPELVLEARYEDVEGRNTTGWTFTLWDGDTLHTRRGEGCGCGSRLRGFRPWTYMVQGPTL